MASAPPLDHRSQYHHLYPQVDTELSDEVLVTKVEIHVSCQKLRNRDILSKSDPMVILFTEHRSNSKSIWKEFDRTEVVMDDLNPFFTKSFIVEYHFEQHQKLKFEVYDSDCSSKNLLKHDYLGHAVVTLGSIVGEYGGKVTKALLRKKGGSTNSTISFSAEELCNNKEMVTLRFQSRKLLRKKLLGHVNPFLVFYRHGIENSDFVAVHRSEVVKNSLNPTWREFSVPLTSLCNGDKHRPIKIECQDWSFDGSHPLIGECNVTINELLSEEDFSKQLIHPKKTNKKYQNCGWLDLLKIDLKCEPSFLEYIFGGVELCVHVAIDFSASNGNPLHPSSLHFLNRDAPNKYVQALSAIGKICEDYDSDKMIPAYGFGAKIHGNVYHDFHLNRMNNPSCLGVAGVLDAYEKFLPTAELYGPTNFSPVINLVSRVAASQTQYKKYHILLILTDGVVTDMDQTKNAIINASRYPLSIIIVGIGDENFSAMDELDSDKSVLTYQGKTAEQDIVQFVPYQKFSGSFAADDLAREVLFEVPRQLVTFMTRHGIKPLVTSQPTNILARSMSASFARIGSQVGGVDKSSRSHTPVMSAKEAALRTLSMYTAR